MGGEARQGGLFGGIPRDSGGAVGCRASEGGGGVAVAPWTGLHGAANSGPRRGRGASHIVGTSQGIDGERHRRHERDDGRVLWREDERDRCGDAVGVEKLCCRPRGKQEDE